MKWYIWSMAMLINYPSLSVERIELTKAIAFVYIIDDIFDLYGKTDELALFTQAINRYEVKHHQSFICMLKASFVYLIRLVYGYMQMGVWCK